MILKRKLVRYLFAIYAASGNPLRARKAGQGVAGGRKLFLKNERNILVGKGKPLIKSLRPAISEEIREAAVILWYNYRYR